MSANDGTVDLPVDGQRSFFDDLKDFNSETERSMDSIRTAGDKEAQRKVLEDTLLPYVPRFGKKIAEIALYSDSDSASLQALKFAADFLFNDKLQNEDAFGKAMDELMNGRSAPSPNNTNNVNSNT